MGESGLADDTCVPCRRGAPLLPPDVVGLLCRDLPAWSLRDDGRRLERSMTFRDFVAAFAFVERVAALSEDQGHHPDLSFGWGYVHVSLHTHAIGGLHRNDFILAAKIDRLVGVP